jgi:5'-3' exonuclease
MHALGVVAWPMIEFEADDALATAVARWGDLPEVEQVIICTPDKDMTQCVRGTRIVCFDRMRRKMIDEAAVVEKFGVPPASIPDWLALVGDSSDGYPGVPRWGAKSAAAVLTQYHHLESIPDNEHHWLAQVRGSSALAASLREHREDAYLYRRLATLRTDAPLTETLDDIRWHGARLPELKELCRELGNDDIIGRVPLWRDEP